MASSAAIALHDHSAAVSNYFVSIRVPASFIAGAAFSGMFQRLTNKPGEPRASKNEALLALGYSVSITLSFMLSINTIMIATAAGIKDLARYYDPMAKSGYDLLRSAFHFEFVVCTWSFLMSLFLLLLAVTNRMLLEFKLFSTEGVVKVRNRELGIAICLLMTSLVFHILSFVNSTLHGWNNFFDMTWDVVKVSCMYKYGSDSLSDLVRNLLTTNKTLVDRGSRYRPLEPLSVIMASGGLALILHALCITS